MGAALLFILGLSYVHAQTVIDMQIQPGLFSGGALYVECQIGARKDKCKVDTGINVSLIPSNEASQEFVSLLKVKHTGVSGAEMICDWVRLPKLVLGSDYLISEQELVRCPVPEGATALLGIDILQHSSVQFNYLTQKIELQKNDPVVFKNSFAEDQLGHILLPVKLGHTKKTIDSKAMFDTGAAMTLVSRSFYEQNPQFFAVVKQSSVTDTKGVVIKTDLAITSLTVGEKSFVAEYVYIMDFSGFQKMMGEDVDLILGHNIISLQNWSFNFSNKTWQ